MTQASALDILKMGHNVFLTGSAGSGKTYVLNAYIKYLREHQVEVAITASTGIAATHMGGMTIHAWSGIGIREDLSDYDIDQMESKKYLWDRFEKVKVLVIDEVSMLSAAFLDNLDRLCRSFKRKDSEPFGGIQIVLCGDLFQLPPIDGNFVVHANAWKNSGLAMCYLTEQHRQEDDAFLDILNAIRANNLEVLSF
jgi:ATP-dependent exoDNAse (exonuclease V) alpha subunit